MALSNVTIQGAQLVLRNFAGNETDMNAAGDRNVGVILPPELALAMQADGWNVKQFKSREEGEEGSFWIPVSLKYKGRDGQDLMPPKVVMITKRADGGINRTILHEQDVETLDWADIKSADIIIRPYEYNYLKRTGVKAYVKTLFVEIEMDELEQKYADLESAVQPRSAASEDFS